jgi:hypothetical protein
MTVVRGDLTGLRRRSWTMPTSYERSGKRQLWSQQFYGASVKERLTSAIDPAHRAARRSTNQQIL